METATLENPVLKETPAISGSDLRSMSEHYDTTGETVTPEPVDNPIEPTADKPEVVKPDVARDEKGKFAKVEKPEVSTDTPPVDETKPVSEYEQAKRDKAAKEKERQDRSWEALNKEKDALRAEREALLQQQKAKPIESPKPARQFHSSDLMRAFHDFRAQANEARKNGDYEAFDDLNTKAEAAFEHAGKFFQEEQQEEAEAIKGKFISEWEADREQVFKDFPDSTKLDTPLGVQMQDLWKSHGKIINSIPRGFSILRDIAQLRLDAAGSAAKDKTISELTARIAELESKTSLAGAGATGPHKTKTFSELSPADQSKRLRQMANDFDAFN